ncbi:coiled-coil domain-containing protein 57 isoform X4 [Dasypus novemcinctus]|uniref:coiled-coil domain-containing protein 57 isoform X4 n=2 Tax=Dasypus novemcinctus TaxID=9361 RepID=UPI00265DEAC3|nr:coiled-coil domain-containing protein 57 isoform X3 [Dasypus novemcinctus]
MATRRGWEPPAAGEAGFKNGELSADRLSHPGLEFPQEYLRYPGLNPEPRTWEAGARPPSYIAPQEELFLFKAAVMLPPPPEQALNELLACKEAEWKALQARCSQLQEAALQDAQGQLEEARGKLGRLQEDFLYNLQVLEERDRELERYDAAFAQAQRLDAARQAEVSELKVEAAKLKQALATEARRAEELRRQHQLRLQEHRRELERMHSDRSGEVELHRQQCEDLQWRLERQLQGLDGELALQRQELLLEFDSAAQKREHEFHLQADHLSSLVLAHELKVKLLNQELEALKGAGGKAAEALQRAETANLELAQEVQRRDQELQSLAAVSDARIKDLEGQLHSVQLTRKREEEVFRRKHEELDRLARGKDAVLASVKEAHGEQLRALEARVQELQAHAEELEAQLRRAERRQADAAQEKATAMAKLREDTSALRSGWDAQMAQLSKEMVSKDLQLHALQEEEGMLRAQLARLLQDIERYQQQLSQAVEREQQLGREKVQLELDWQRRRDAAEQQQYLRSEALLQGLTAARDQVAAKLEATERTLCDREALLKALTLERDQAVLALRMQGPHPEDEAQIPLRHHEEEISQDFPSGEIQRLQEQNTSLRDAVAQMRREMEALSGPAAPSAQPGGYTLALEAEIQNLKHKFKALEEQLGDVLEPSKMSSSHPHVQHSVQPRAVATGTALQDTGAATALAVRKLGGRVALLDTLALQLRRTVRLRAPGTGAGQRQLLQEVGQVRLEVLELRKQVSELERHLGAAGEEGTEAASREQPQAPDRATLGAEGPAGGEPAVQGLSSLGARGARRSQDSCTHQLRQKLKDAARTILGLCQEKEQLMEMGNRLRAELGRGRASDAVPGLLKRTRQSATSVVNGAAGAPPRRSTSAVTVDVLQPPTCTCRDVLGPEAGAPVVALRPALVAPGDPAAPSSQHHLPVTTAWWCSSWALARAAASAFL